MEPSEKDFFIRIKKAISLNPFSSQRLAVDLELTGLSPGSPNEEIINKLTHTVSGVIERVRQRNRDQVKSLSADDSELLRYGMLFQVFHLYCDDYDQLIQQQVERGKDSCKVIFAREVLQRLTDFGLSESDALQSLALFFQMRRAYFFIRNIAGESQCVKELRKSLWNNIFTSDLGLYDTYLWNRMEDFSTMLLGETGTGKGMAASAIGRSGFIPFDVKTGCFSESFVKTFITINLSQFSEQLIESELFGHKKGAFTGAVDAHKGVFARCSPHGAIFLDEIGDVSVPVQIKLLQVLQDRHFSPVGSHNVERFQGRVIAATNQSIKSIREQGEFRDDFYYRLCSDTIEVPTLRKRLDEHPDEIFVILSFIIKRILGRSSQELVQEIGEYILTNQPKDYPWPGNVRELEQCVRQILLRWNYTWQQSPDEPVEHFSTAIENGSLTAQQLLAYYCHRLYVKLGTYEAVGEVTELDRRTVKKYVVHYQQR